MSTGFRAGRVIMYDKTTAFQANDEAVILHIHLNIVDTPGTLDMGYGRDSNQLHVTASHSTDDYTHVFTKLRENLVYYLANLHVRGATVPQEIRLHSSDYNNELIEGNSSSEPLRTILMPPFDCCNGVDWYVDREQETADKPVQSIRAKAESATDQLIDQLVVPVKADLLTTVLNPMVAGIFGVSLLLIATVFFKLGQRYPDN